MRANRQAAVSAAEAARRYRANHPERVKEIQRRSREANREKVSAAQRRRRQGNREQIAARDRAYYRANREKVIGRHRNRDRVQARWAEKRRRHGVLPEQWAALWAAQDGCCYLCGNSLPARSNHVHIDHDHRCPYGSCPRCWRGLACNRCNTLIGLADDDPARLHRIADNLARAKRRLSIPVPPATLFDLPELWATMRPQIAAAIEAAIAADAAAIVAGLEEDDAP